MLISYLITALLRWSHELLGFVPVLMPVSVQVQPLALLPFAALITFVPSFSTGAVTAQVAWNCFFQLNVLSFFPLWAHRFTSKGERWRLSVGLGVPRSTGADSLERMLRCSLEIGGKVHLLKRNLADSTHRNASESSTLQLCSHLLLPGALGVKTALGQHRHQFLLQNASLQGARRQTGLLRLRTASCALLCKGSNVLERGV